MSVGERAVLEREPFRVGVRSDSTDRLGRFIFWRGEVPKSVFVQELLDQERLRREREAFYRDAVAAYTPAVCEETLELNAATPFVSE